MRKYRRDLERTDQADTRHIGRRHRGNILPLVENPARRRLQKLGQEIEAGGLAGPVRANQGVNTAPPNLERDVANSKETREFLGQSVGFENELIGQTNFPLATNAATPPAAFFPARQVVPRTARKTIPEPPPPRRNMPSMERVKQGGKLGIGATLVEGGRPSLKLLNAIAAAGSRLHRKFSNLSPSCTSSWGSEALQGLEALDFE